MSTRTIKTTNGGGGIYNSGVVNANVAAPTVIAHGLGTIPAHIKITTYSNSTNKDTSASTGTFDGINQQSIGYDYNSAGAGSLDPVIDNVNIVHLSIQAATANSFGLVSMDATNITINWTNLNGGVNSALFWEAFT